MPKFSILSPISDDILQQLCSDDPIKILFQLAWFLPLRIKPFLDVFIRIFGYNCCNISLTIGTNMLIISKDTFVALIAWMISTNPVRSQILIFVTSHFAPLYLF